MKTRFKTIFILALLFFFVAGFSSAQEVVPPPSFSHPSGAELEKGTEIKVSKVEADKLFVWQTTNTAWPVRFREYTDDTVKCSMYSSPMYIWAYTEKDGKSSDTLKMSYTFPTPEAPAFSVQAGDVKVGTRVRIGCTTPGATIYYTYGEGAFVRYSAPLLVCENITVKAYAEKDLMRSDTSEVSYTVEMDETLEIPGFSNVSGTLIEKGGIVSVYRDRDKTDSMFVWRTSDTTVLPSWIKAPLDTVKYPVTGNLYIWAMTAKGGKRSKTVKASYALLPPQHPVFNPTGSELNVGDSIELTSATKAATIWYAEGKAGFKKYSNKFPIYNDVAIKAFAQNGVNSDTTTETYTVRVNAGLGMPTFSEPNGTLVNKGTRIEVYKEETADYNVIWRTGDTTGQPQWSAYTNDTMRYLLNGDMYIWAFSVKNGQRSPIAKMAYSFKAVKPEAPTFSEADGTDGLSRQVWVRKGKADELYYTSNGVLEGGDTIFRPIMYGQKDSGYVSIAAPRVTVLAYNTNKGPWGTILYSDTVSATYRAHVFNPYFRFEAGSGNTSDAVKVYWKVGMLYFSVNEDKFQMAEEGTYGREGDMNVKTWVVLDSMRQIRAYVRSGGLISDTITFDVEGFHPVAMPVFSIASGTGVEKETMVQVRKGDADSLFVWQTTDTTATPNFIKTNADSIAVKINAAKFVWAYAKKGKRESDMAKAFWDIKKTETPEFTPSAGDILKGSKVTITAVEGAEIYVAKGKGAFEKYTEAIVVDEDVTLKAFAVKAKCDNSDTITAAYVVKEAPEAPVFAPGAGEVERGTLVRITCGTMRAEIYVDKGNGEFVKYTNPIAITEEITLRAFATKDGYSSDTVEAEYTIKEDVAVGVDELAGVSVYPNPNKGEFYVTVPVNATIEVFAANGQKVFVMDAVAGKNVVKLNNAGIYFVRVRANGQDAIRKVVVR